MNIIDHHQHHHYYYNQIVGKSRIRTKQNSNHHTHTHIQAHSNLNNFPNCRYYVINDKKIQMIEGGEINKHTKQKKNLGKYQNVYILN